MSVLDRLCISQFCWPRRRVHVRANANDITGEVTAVCASWLYDDECVRLYLFAIGHNIRYSLIYGLWVDDGYVWRPVKSGYIAMPDDEDTAREILAHVIQRLMGMLRCASIDTLIALRSSISSELA